jgi:hypothetical protein
LRDPELRTQFEVISEQSLAIRNEVSRVWEILYNQEHCDYTTHSKIIRVMAQGLCTFHWGSLKLNDDFCREPSWKTASWLPEEEDKKDLQKPYFECVNSRICWC